jgi:hypothetical protein
MENQILTEATSLIDPGEVWSELHQDLILDSKGQVKKVLNEQAVVASLDNILRTSPMERVMLPNFGAGLDDLLFENVSQSLATELAGRIKDSITKWDDRVIINSIDFNLDPNSNFLGVSMSFSIVNYADILEYETTITAGV